MARLPWCMALLLTCLAGVANSLLATDNPFSMSAHDFRELSDFDRKATVASAFEHRLKHAQNVFYESKTHYRIHEYDNGHVGKLVKKLSPDAFRHWRLGDSYRMDIDRYDGSNAVAPPESSSNGFDAIAGVVRGFMREPNSKRLYARIDTVHNPPTEANRYAYWLDGNHNAKAEYLFRYLVDHQTTFDVQITDDDAMVRLTLPWTPLYQSSPWGTRQFTLDPKKGFLPIDGVARWDDPSPRGGKPSWRFEQFTVEESRLVADVWMPTKLKETVGGSPRPNRVTVHATEVLKIEAGTVRPKDLMIAFPEGTYVVDAIQGVAYKTDANGEPIGTVEGLVGASPTIPVPYVAVAKPSRLGRALFMFGGVLVLATIVVYFVRRAKLRDS